MTTHLIAQSPPAVIYLIMGAQGPRLWWHGREPKPDEAAIVARYVKDET